MIITIQKCLVPQCEGAAHKWEFQRPTLRELERMEDVAGIDVDQFATGLTDVLSPGVSRLAIKATLALADILHRRDGVRVPYEDIDIDIGDFDIAVDETDIEPDGQAEEDGEGKDPAPAPTSPPREEPAPAEPGSGPATEEESEPRSSSTPTGSGGGSASP
jgi:hypothetical protein